MPASSHDRALRDEAKRIFGLVLECDPAKRADHLRELCGTRLDLFDEVNSLLASAIGLESFFESPPAGNITAPADPMIGRRVGSYKVLRQIGSGGMGAVYLAERADDQFRKRVALKTLRAGLIDEHAMRRFQNERQTLAVLDHPNIIKLLDGGNTEDGIPWLVMEYVEGQPIDKYCTVRKLPLREKLELLRTVLGAVHYAHQSLIVHRDLKPGNILVTAEGVPKLLDFGIAKLLRPEYLANSIGLTRTDLQPMTPEYASPEQVLGHSVTTATDIYSLGVILYRLLTGKHPYETKTHSAFELERAICETKPERPSRFAVQSKALPVAEAMQLQGDVDTIALKAMSKEPQRRYASAEHFAEDIRRYLEGWPILARKANIRYRAAKFVGRHKAASVGGALLMALLCVLAWSTWEQKRAAERRFADLRKFANWTLTDLDGKLREGPTPARMELTKQGLQYLDSLEREKSDPSIQRDLFNGYMKTGDVLGNLYLSNMGQTGEAAASYRKALKIADELIRGDPRDIENQRRAVRAHVALGQVLVATGNQSEAAKQYDDAAQANTLVQATQPTDQKTLLDMATIWQNIGSSRSLLSDPEGAAEAYRHALETVRRLPDSYPRKKFQIAFSSEMVAYFSAISGDPSGAEASILQSIETYGNLLETNPTHNLRRTLAKAWKHLAETQGRLGKVAESLVSVDRSHRITDEMLRADPESLQLAMDAEQVSFLKVRLLAPSGKLAEQRSETRRALAVMREQADRKDAPYPFASDYAELLATTPFPELRDDAAALTYAQRAVSLTSPPPADLLHVLALAYARNGDSAKAADADRQALKQLPPVKPGRRPPELRTELETELAGLTGAGRP